MTEMTQGRGGGPKGPIIGATQVSSRSPEMTLSTPRGELPREASVSHHDTRATRLLLGVTLTTGGTLGFLGVVLLQLIAALNTPPPMVGAGEGRGAIGPMCQDGSDQGCDEGEICLGGRCVLAKKADECQLGDACGTAAAMCTCGGELRCVDHVCQAPERATATCDDATVAEVLKGIAESCDGDLGTCDADKLGNFAVESKDFDAVLAKFPSTITVHFPDKSPPLESRRVWPVDPMQAHYRSRLAHRFVVEALAKAEDVLLIGRSSEGGQVSENYEYSRLRVEAVKDLLMANVRTQDEQKVLLGKIHKLLLSNRRVLAADFFSKHYTNRLIAWSREVEETLRANIAGYDALRGRGRAWTNRILNQVVFVVPLPCKLPPPDGARK